MLPVNVMLSVNVMPHCACLQYQQEEPLISANRVSQFLIRYPAESLRLNVEDLKVLKSNNN